MDAIKKKVQEEIDVLKKWEKESKNLRNQRQLLNGQLSENEVVKSELDQVKGNEEVYKMIGKLLVKQELPEAQQTVSKRIDYIKNEIKRVDNASAITEVKLEDCRKNLIKLQKELQQLSNVTMGKS